MAESEKKSFDYKAWYAANKDEVSERRRKRYAEDPEYREKRKTHSERFYWLKQRPASRVGKPLEYEALDLVPDGVVHIVVENEDDVRYGMELEVPVFYPSTVAAAIRRSMQTLRLWFLKGLLLDVMMRNARGYRLFTEDQLRLLVENRHWLGLSVQDFEKHPFFALVNEGWARMPDGIEPMLRDEWRVLPEPCPHCGAAGTLQQLVDGEWASVNCFKCLNPLHWRARQTMKVFIVTGVCDTCGYLNEVEVEASEESKVRVTCEKCGRPVHEFDVLERGEH